MKAKDVTRILEEVAIVNSSIPIDLGLVTVAGKLDDDMAPGTQNTVFKQAGLKK